MFCFQCEQTAGGTGCTKMGVCGKSNVTADFQDELTGALVGLAKAAGNAGRSPKSDELILRGLFMCITNVNFDNQAIQALTDEIRKEKSAMSPGCAACGPAAAAPMT